MLNPELLMTMAVMATGVNNDASNGKPDNFLKGTLDEFLVYEHALTDNEVNAHYEMGAENL